MSGTAFAARGCRQQRTPTSNQPRRPQMRKLAPVFLISIFAIGSASALAMGDRKKEKADTATKPAATAPATSTPSTNNPSPTSSTNGASKMAAADSERNTAAGASPAIPATPATPATPASRSDATTTSASPATAATPATPSPKSSARNNPAANNATCKEGKDAQGLPCLSGANDAGTSGGSGTASGSSAGGA